LAPVPTDIDVIYEPDATVLAVAAGQVLAYGDTMIIESVAV
jgi:hypothetical protein